MNVRITLKQLGEFMLIIGLVGGGVFFGITGYPIITANANIQNIWLTSTDGTPFVAAYITPKKTYDGQPLIVICHGFSSSYYNTVSLGILLAEKGFPVIVPSFRGHALSGGVSRIGKYAWREVIASINWVSTHDKKANTTNVGVIGTSMGAAISMVAAAMDPRIRAVVEYSGFANMSLLLNETDLVYFFGGFEYLIPEISDFAPVAYLTADKNFSLLIMHGDADRKVPLDQAYLLNSSPLPHKEMRIYHGEGHGLIWNSNAFNDGYSWLCNKLGVQYPGPVDTTFVSQRLTFSYIGIGFIFIAILGFTILLGEAWYRDTTHEKINVIKPPQIENRYYFLLSVGIYMTSVIVTAYFPELELVAGVRPLFAGSILELLAVIPLYISTEERGWIYKEKRFLKKGMLHLALSIAMVVGIVDVLALAFWFKPFILRITFPLFLAEIFIMVFVVERLSQYVLDHRGWNREWIIISIIIETSMYGTSIAIIMGVLGAPLVYIIGGYSVGLVIAITGHVIRLHFDSSLYSSLFISVFAALLVSSYFPAI